jgi:hypothetical protein
MEKTTTAKKNTKISGDTGIQSDMFASPHFITEHAEYPESKDIRIFPLIDHSELPTHKLGEDGQYSERRELGSSDSDLHDIVSTFTSRSIGRKDNALRAMLSTDGVYATAYSDAGDDFQQDPMQPGNWERQHQDEYDNNDDLHGFEDPDIDERALCSGNILSPSPELTVTPSADRWPLTYKRGYLPLNVFDRIQLFIERHAGMPILWWPIRQPNRPLPAICSRLSWDLVSGPRKFWLSSNPNNHS